MRISWPMNLLIGQQYSRYGGYVNNDYTPPSIEMGMGSNFFRL